MSLRQSTSKFSAKIYGNEYTQQTDDGKHVKMVWIDRNKNPELVGFTSAHPYKYPQYIKVSELMRFKEAGESKSEITKKLEAAKEWLALNKTQGVLNSPKVQSCTVTNKGEVIYPVRPAAEKELQRDARDVNFWLQVYGANPESITEQKEFNARATKLYALELAQMKGKPNLPYNGYFFGRQGPIYQDVLAFVRTLAEHGVASIVGAEPLEEDAELIRGVEKMRDIITRLSN